MACSRVPACLKRKKRFKKKTERENLYAFDIRGSSIEVLLCACDEDTVARLIGIKQSFHYYPVKPIV